MRDKNLIERHGMRFLRHQAYLFTGILTPCQFVEKYNLTDRNMLRVYARSWGLELRVLGKLVRLCLRSRRLRDGVLSDAARDASLGQLRLLGECLGGDVISKDVKSK